jgi:hypothetical protein
MNDLEAFFRRHDGRLLHKWHHYFEIYDRHLARFRGKPVCLVEFGVSQGGSLDMWRHYFGREAQIFGIDINPNFFPLVKADGVYLIEDLHTSYWKRWGGGYRKRASFIEYSKNFIDQLNAWHSREPRRLRPSDFTRSVDSLHYYDSVLVIEKRPRSEPTHERKGQRLFPDYEHQSPRWIDRIRRKLR